MYFRYLQANIIKERLYAYANNEKSIQTTLKTLSRCLKNKENLIQSIGPGMITPIMKKYRNHPQTVRYKQLYNRECAKNSGGKRQAQYQSVDYR